ncbi:MAG: hypothetical protein FWC50_00630 [Planctomycetaceae bacterium]|nr:hypothetical protein [Planctomycetaceae bacterium]
MIKFRWILAAFIFVCMVSVLRAEELLPPSLTPWKIWVIRDYRTAMEIYQRMETTDYPGAFLPHSLVLDLPREIYAWYGMTVTDGTHLWTVLGFRTVGDLHLQLESHDMDDFRMKLLKHSIIADCFPDGKIKFVNHEDMLCAVSEDFPTERLGELKLQEHWQALLNKCDFGYQDNNTDDKLLPMLPPESENEGSFIQAVRKARAAHPDQTLCEMDYIFYGLLWNGRSFEGVMETKPLDGTQTAEQYKIRASQEPFGVGGFCDELSSDMSMALRFYPGEKSFDSRYFDLHGGTVVIPPDERKGEDKGKLYAMNLHYGLFVDDNKKLAEIKKERHVLECENILITYPKQNETLLPEEGVLTADQLDTLNRRLAESVLAFVENIRDCSQSWEKGKVTDIAFEYDRSHVFAACSLPTGGGKTIDWNLFSDIKENLNELLEQTTNHKKGAANPLEAMQITPHVAEYQGVVFSNIHVPLSDEKKEDKTAWACGVIGIGPDFLCLAFHISDPDIPTLVTYANAGECQAALLQQLKAKIDESKRLVAEKTPFPKKWVNFDTEICRFFLEDEIKDGISVDRIVFNVNSFDTVLALGKQFGGSFLQKYLPFAL